MVLHKKRDSVFKGDDVFDWRYTRMAFKDPFVYLASRVLFFSSVAIFGFGTFLPTIIRDFGFSKFQANYLIIPVYFIGEVPLVIQAYFSDRMKQRALFQLFSACFVVVGYLICVGSASPVARYIEMFILVSGVYAFSFGLPLFEFIGNLSGLVSSQLYPSKQGPRYVIGNSVSAGMEYIAAVLAACTLLLLRNKNAKTEKLIAEGATTNELEGDMALGFKYCL